jgi:hypothetical protein
MPANKFIDEDIQAIPGWLVRDAAYLTLWLLERQLGLASGPMMEIGVFGGKYLAVLYHGSRHDRLSSTVLGIDIYSDISRAAVTENMGAVCGDLSRLRLVETDSSRLSAEEVLASCTGQRPRFVSVDGSHLAQGVRSDLALVEKVIAEAGIVAVDDFLNPLAIGVCNGFYEYFLRAESDLVPLVYSANKLFMCTRQSHAHYRTGLDEYVDTHQFLPTVADYTARKPKGKAWVEQEILSQPVLII